MPLELECKIPLQGANSLGAVAARLTAFGAVANREEFEQNYLFDRNDELSTRREVLRLRIINHAAEGLVTHKSPVKSGAYKARQETETAVADAVGAREIFRALGFLPTLMYEKKRRNWRWEDCNVALDTLPYLGDFIEVEAPAPEILDAAISRLGLDPRDHLDKSYGELWKDYCNAREWGVRECRF